MDHKEARLKQQEARFAARGATWNGSGRTCTLQFVFDVPKKPIEPTVKESEGKVSEGYPNIELSQQAGESSRLGFKHVKSKNTKKRKQKEHTDASSARGSQELPPQGIPSQTLKEGSRMSPTADFTNSRSKQIKRRRQKDAIPTPDLQPVIESEPSTKQENHPTRKKTESTGKFTLSVPLVTEGRPKKEISRVRKLAESDNPRKERGRLPSSDEAGKMEGHNPPTAACEEDARPVKRKRILRNDVALSWNTPIEATTRRTTLDFGLGLAMKRTR